MIKKRNNALSADNRALQRVGLNIGKTMSKKSIAYRFNAYEPGAFLEIYLPKKTKFQGTLYEILTDGFNWDSVKKHLLDNKEEIKELLELYDESFSFFERIDKVEQFYWGYSLYEVDGVFFSSARKAIDEERTQVIRLMFLPDFEGLQKVVPDMKFEELRKHVRRMIEEDRFTRKEESEKHVHLKALYEKIDEWVDNTGVFVFGYIIFKLCTRIKELEDNENIKPEEVIWVTSFWNLNVNKVTIPKKNK